MTGQPAASRSPLARPAAYSVPDAYQRYGPALVRKAERIVQNSDDAIDLVHGLFVDLMHKGTRDVELRYLYRAITNRCLNHIRDIKNRQQLLERQEPALRGPVRTRCDDQVLGLDLQVKLAAKLDKRSLDVLICRYWDDMTQAEIAAFLGTSRKTVGKRLRKIREQVGALATQPRGQA